MQRQSGFSLIEMLMVIIILGILAGMSAMLLSEGFKAFFKGEDILDANAQGQLAIQRMSRDISLIRSPADISTATASQLSFVDINGNSISYSLSSSNLNLTKGASTQTLAGGISSLTFTYYNSSGTTPAGSTTAIRYIKIALNVTQNNTNYTLTTAIYPRNCT